MDMDAFFLSVELRDRPDLAGRAAVVAHPSGRSVVLSASYEARAYGVRSAMPLVQARSLCPPLEVIPPRQGLYRQVSAAVMALFATVTPVLEQLSVDEAFLDVAGARRRLGPPEEVAHLVRARVRRELGLPCTVGGACVKFVAKMASTAAKPDGLLLVPPARTLEFLHPLPVGRLWGVGPQAARRLAVRGIGTVGELAATDPARLRAWFGAPGVAWHELAWGVDPRPVAPRAAAKSLGADHTFDVDPTDRRVLAREVLRLSHHVGGRLRAEGVRAGAVTVRLKAPDGSVRSRTARLPRPTAAGQDLVGPARALMTDLLDERPHPVRLVGVRAERLDRASAAPEQGMLFGGPEDTPGAGEWTRAEEAADAVARRFPGAAVRPASLLPGRPPTTPAGRPGTGLPGPAGRGGRPGNPGASG
ncbi:MAG: DNA polymerase IV [Micrococcus sp.]|nr:DNA polymerase IV [Micrococcus sp.]